jgi:hypothetical protein
MTSDLTWRHINQTLNKSSFEIEYETNIETGTVNPQNNKIFFTVPRFKEFSSFTSSIEV